MTAIAAIVSDGEVWMGGDSAMTQGDQIWVAGDEKVFQVGEFLMGFCGSPRFMQLVKHGLEAPIHDPSLSDEAYIVLKLADAIRTCVDSGGKMKRELGQEWIGGGILLGYRGRLYMLDGDLCLTTPRENFAAMGSGDSILFGHLSATEEALDPKDSEWAVPEWRIRKALEAAERFNSTVRAPFIIKRLERDGIT